MKYALAILIVAAGSLAAAPVSDLKVNTQTGAVVGQDNFWTGNAGGIAAALTATYQPLDPDLTAIAALVTTTYGRSFLVQADAAAARSTLGLGTLATQDGSFSGTSSGLNTGDQTLATITGTLPASKGGTGATALGATLSITGGTLDVVTSSTGAPGVAQLATDTEIQTGTNTAKVVRVSGLSAWWTWVKTQAQTIAGNWTFSGTTSMTGDVTATDASGDKMEIYAGTLIAPNATPTNSDRLANVGALDGRYERKGLDYVLNNFSGVSTALSGGSVNAGPNYLQVRANAGDGNYASALWQASMPALPSNSFASLGFDPGNAWDVTMVVGFQGDIRSQVVLLPLQGNGAFFAGRGLGAHSTGWKVPGWLVQSGTMYAVTHTYIRGSGSATRASNVVTVNTNGNHNLSTGDYVAIGSAQPVSFQTARTQVTVTGTTAFTYSSTGSNESTSNSGDLLGISKLTEVGSTSTSPAGDSFSTRQFVIRHRMSAGTCQWWVDGTLIATATGMPTSPVSANINRVGVGSISSSSATNVTDIIISSVLTSYK